MTSLRLDWAVVLASSTRLPNSLADGGPAAEAPKVAVAQVVVVGADDDRFVRQRTGALDDAEDVLALRPFALDTRGQLAGPAFQGAALGGEVLVDGLLQGEQVRVG